MSRAAAAWALVVLGAALALSAMRFAPDVARPALLYVGVLMWIAGCALQFGMRPGRKLER